MDEKGKKKLIYDSSQETKQARQDIYVKLLHRYFHGDSTDKEKQAVEEWDAEHSWSRYTQRMDERKMEEDCEGVWNNLEKKLHFKRKSRKRIIALRNYAAAAVLLLLVLGVGGLYLPNQSRSDSEALVANYDTYETGMHERKEIHLPDGSIVHLNRDSHLHLLANEFDRKQREVWLEGEAFFEVSKNPKKEFIIHSGNLKTVVKGTSFNIKAYKDLKEDAITVRSGRVEIFTDNEQLATLTKNQQLMYNREKDSYETETADWQDAASWLDGGFVLNYANTEELKMRIKQYYGVEMEIRDKALKGIHLKSSFVEGTKIEEVMNTLCKLYNVKYTIENSRVILHK
ncbi:FecR family protein [uncultured Bacteroides sp.]|uniref:FecR family protein n=1 Tax=uncultured Bacteroides sp. TaxID=162156 RepID=UPI002AA8E092|nr:FecR family protein [uncultured Bacteroides sp.]